MVSELFTNYFAVKIDPKSQTLKRLIKGYKVFIVALNFEKAKNMFYGSSLKLFDN